MEKGKDHSRNYTTYFVAVIIPRRLERRAPNCCVGSKARSCDLVGLIFFFNEGGGGVHVKKIIINLPNHYYVL